MGPLCLALPEFLKKNSYQDVTNPLNTPLQLAFNTELPSWQYFKTKPEWAEDMVLVLGSRRKHALTWLSVYPLQEEAASLDPEHVLLVDVGGGSGPQCRALKDKYPNLPGRVILQDLQQMLVHAPAIEGVEKMEHDFFTPQKVKGRPSSICTGQH